MGRTLIHDLHTYVVRNRKPKDKDDQALFINRMGERLRYDGMQMLIRRVLEANEINGSTGPHKIRHTMATSFLRNGGNVVALKDILSHTDIKTTMRYVNLLSADVQEMHRAASPLDNLRR
jgi:site-specific recombinase XerD